MKMFPSTHSSHSPIWLTPFLSGALPPASGWSMAPHSLLCGNHHLAPSDEIVGKCGKPLEYQNTVRASLTLTRIRRWPSWESKLEESRVLACFCSSVSKEGNLQDAGLGSLCPHPRLPSNSLHDFLSLSGRTKGAVHSVRSYALMWPMVPDLASDPLCS